MDIWVAHLVGIQDMIEVGCQFGPNDLTVAEWKGLVELADAQRELVNEVDSS